MADAFEVRERGRRQHYTSCHAYFEVVSVPAGDGEELEVFAINHSGEVINHAKVYRSDGFTEGMMVELIFYDLNAKDDAGWWSQAPKEQHRNFHSSIALAAPSASVNTRSSEFMVGEPVVPERRVRRMRNGYIGAVVVNTRSRTFHHPDSQCVSTMTNTKHRKTLPSPEAAQKQYFTGCTLCIWDPLND